MAFRSQPGLDETSAKRLVLFIHGLGGSEEETWGEFPQLLMRDFGFREHYSIGLFGYQTMLIRGLFSPRSASVRELAAALRTRIENRYAEFPRVVLVCHSLGGLIGRQYILEEFKAGRTLRAQGIVLFATPNNGAELARVSAALSWRHAQASQLAPYSEAIENLNSDWFTMGLNRAIPACYVWGTQDRVVDRFSAAAVWGNPDLFTVEGKGHIDIVKPERADDDVVLIVRNFLKRLGEGQGAVPVETAVVRPARKEDWEEELDVAQFHGRSVEVAEVARLMREVRLLAIAGRGGIGKSALLRKTALEASEGFECVIWRSLKQGRTLNELLASCLRVLPDDGAGVIPAAVADRLQLLMQQLKKKRCLILIDNLETIFAGDGTAGVYREEYREYAEFFRRVGSTVHRSCVVLTSREIPQELNELGDSGPVRIYPLKGIDADAASQLLAERKISADAATIRRLTELYAGSPQGINLAVNPILKVFGGDVLKFIEEGTAVFGETERCLAWHFERMIGFERDVLYWLAIMGEPTSFAELQRRFEISGEVKQGALQEAIESLDQRSILEISNEAFFLQGLVLAYVLRRLVEEAQQEIRSGEVRVLRSHALVTATAKDPLRRMQERLIVRALTGGFSGEGPGKLRERLTGILASCKTRERSGYLAGNVVNILRVSGGSLNGLDLSRMPVWEAFLQGVEMRDANLAGADLVNPVFSETFGDILSVASSTAGGLVATGSLNGDIRLWSLPDHRLLHRFDGHRDGVWTLAFSPDGRTLVSGGEDATVRFWDMEKREQTACLIEPMGPVFAVAFHSDGAKLAFCGDNETVGIYDLRSRTVTMSPHPAAVYAIAWAADGKQIATGASDHLVRTWRVNPESRLELERELPGHSDWVRSIAFSPGGEWLASGSYDRSIRIWNLATDTCWKELRDHTGWVRAVAFHGNGLLASSGNDGTVRIWNAALGKCTHVFQGHAGTVWNVCWTADGRTVISGGNDQTIRYWDLASGESTAMTRGFANPVRAISFHPNGETLAVGCGDHQIRLWGLQTGSRQLLRGHSDWVRALSYTPDGNSLISAGNDRTVRVWNAASLECEEILTGHENWIYAVATDGRTAVTCSTDGTVRVWEWPGPVCRVFKHSDSEIAAVYAVAMPETGGLIASGGNDRLVKIHDAATLLCRHVLRGHENTVTSLSFDREGKLLASGGDRSIRLWNAGTGALVRTIDEAGDRVRSIRLNFDGTWVASGSDDGSVRLWDCATGECRWTAREHTGVVGTLAFHPQGDVLASGSSDETIRFWNLNSGVCVRELRNERPYEGTRIAGARGLTDAQRGSLRALGAI